MTKIDVTQEFLRDGDANVPNKSPIALGLRAAFPDRRLYVYSDGFEDLGTGERVNFADHDGADRARLFFITDPRKRRPFSFEINWPEKSEDAK